MAKLQPIKDFQDVRKFLARIPYLHDGGCGISALAMYRWHKKNTKLVNQRIVLCYIGQSSFRANSGYLAGLRGGYPSSVTHCGIIYDNRETHTTEPVDARGFVALSSYDYVHIIKDESALLAMVNGGKHWNEKFNRGVNVPKIARRLGIDLSDVKEDGISIPFVVK
jgi:hypothetical protein